MDVRNNANLNTSAFLFILAHLALIPIFNFYGCPYFSIKMGILFSTFVILLNLILGLWVTRYFTQKWNYSQSAIKLNYFRISVFLGYLLIFSTGTFFVVSYFNSELISASVIHSTLLAFFYSGTILSVLALQIADWLALNHIRELRETISHSDLIDIGKKSASEKITTQHWFENSIWNLTPEFAAIIIAGSEFFRFYEIIKYEFFQTSIHKEILYESTLSFMKTILLLSIWLIGNSLFKFFKELRMLNDVKKHLHELGQLNPHYFSMPMGNSFWKQIFHFLNQTTHKIEQRTRLAKGFSAYVALDVVEQFMSLTGEKQNGSLMELTLISSDLRDFTQMSHSLDPEKIVETLNIYFEDMVEVLILKQVLLDKFMGDGILAYVDPQVKSILESAELAVSAALAMQEELVKTNEKLIQKNLPALKMGVAIHSGPVVLGSIGSSRRMQYTIIGDTVNLTCRLESLCKTLDACIVITESIWQSLPSKLQNHFSDLGQQNIRGLNEKIQIYGILNQTQLETQHQRAG